jgi:uncharacterized protein YcbK (DUF882 family)
MKSASSGKGVRRASPLDLSIAGFLKLALMAAIFATVFSFGTGNAQAQTRTLKIHFTHTKERAEITFKRNGRYDQSGLQQLNRILRDWRRNEPTNMDPRLFDLLWEVYQASGSRDYIYVVSAYRSPTTNNMLRSRSSGVAQKSQHTLGKAIDFFLPDVPVRRLRELGMKFQVGGVGFYPNSGSPFVHLDVGSVRAWPRMSRQELSALFPDGKTLHLPPDGRKLAGYDAALADYKRRVGASEIAVAGGGSRSNDGGGGNRRNLFAMLFGNNGDEDEDATAIAAAQPAPARRQAAPSAPPAAVAQAPAQPQPPQAVANVLPASARAPIPVQRPVIGQVPPPQVAALAPVGPATPPPGTSLASATLPADMPPPSVQAAEAAPEEAPAPREFADLSGYTVPVPSFLADRSGVAVYAADEAPAFEGRDVTDVLMADATDQATSDGEALQTALVPRPASRPEFAAIEAATGGGSQDREEAAATLAALAEMNSAVVAPGAAVPSSPAGEASGAVPAPQAAPSRPAVETAALSPDALGSGVSAGGTSDEGDSLAARMAGAFQATPLKGGRPTEADATRNSNRGVVRTEPKLTERMISRWAIGQDRLAQVSKPVASPRFVSKELRASPDMVYTTGFSAENVDSDRFTGTAVNFLSVARFAKAN